MILNSKALPWLVIIHPSSNFTPLPGLRSASGKSSNLVNTFTHWPGGKVVPGVDEDEVTVAAEAGAAMGSIQATAPSVRSRSMAGPMALTF